MISHSDLPVGAEVLAKGKDGTMKQGRVFSNKGKAISVIFPDRSCVAIPKDRLAGSIVHPIPKHDHSDNQNAD